MASTALQLLLNPLLSPVRPTFITTADPYAYYAVDIWTEKHLGRYSDLPKAGTIHIPPIELMTCYLMGHTLSKYQICRVDP
jgi:hypothetical protein